MGRIFILSFLLASIFYVKLDPLYASPKQENSVKPKQGFVSPEAVSGILIDLNLRKRLLFLSVNRQIITFQVDKNAVFMMGDAKVFLSDIVPGDTLEVTYQTKGGKRLAQSVQVEPSDWRRKSYKGLYGY